MKILQAIFLSGLMVLSVSTPARAQTPLKVTQVYASPYWLQAMFTLSDGSLWGMGYDADGELGLGPADFVETPTMVFSNGVVAVSMGFLHTGVVMSDGSLWMAGYNYWGQLGDGTTNTQHTFEKVIPANVKSVSCGDYHTLFTTTVVTGVFPHQTITQNLYSMGLNNHGQLGDGTTNTHYTPYLVQSTNFIGATPCVAGSEYSLFLKPNGAMYGMGANIFGELGTGNTNEFHSPTLLHSPEVISMASGGITTYLIMSDGTLYGTGVNDYGELGDGGTTTRLTPEKIDTNVVSISSGGQSTFYLKSNGDLWAMGANYGGSFGIGTTISYATPQLINNNIAGMAVGNATAYIIDTNGVLYGAGDGSYAQLGDSFDFIEPVFNQIYPRVPITIDRVQIVNGTNLAVVGTCAEYGNYALVSGPKLTTPFDQFVPVWTNTPSFRGYGNLNFTATNVVANIPFRFFMLKKL